LQITAASVEKIKGFVKTELEIKKIQLKNYFCEQQKWVQKQLKQLDEEREFSKKWTREVQDWKR
jgi:hypothetical protein